MFYKDMVELGERLDELEYPNGIKSWEVLAWYMAHQRIVNLLDEAGMEWHGFSWTYRVPLGLLVVKASIKGQRVVCFVTCEGCTTGFKIFFRLLNAGLVQWQNDKFART